MDLVDLIGENELQQDEWSLTIPTFGEEGQLTVAGWSGKSLYNKYYILKCTKCSEDYKSWEYPESFKVCVAEVCQEIIFTPEQD